MDFDDQCTHMIQHDIAFLQNRKGKLRFLRAYCRLYLKLWTTIERVHERMSHGKTIVTNIEYEHEQY